MNGMRLVLSVCGSWLTGMLGLLLLKRSCHGIFEISAEILSMIIRLKPRDLKKLVNVLEWTNNHLYLSRYSGCK